MNSNEYSREEFNSIEHRGTANSYKRNNNRKSIIIILFIAVIVIGAILIWKQIQITSLKKQAAAEKQELQKKATNIILNTNAEHLKLLAKPFIWAVRTEMMNGNISQVNLYSNDLVKEKNFQNIVIADNKGLIISSTNKKLEGKDFSVIGKPAYLSSDSTMVDNIKDSVLVVYSPIMGFNNRLGTLMFTYTLPKPNLR